jgi:hypothetical protein
LSWLIRIRTSPDRSDTAISLPSRSWRWSIAKPTTSWYQARLACRSGVVSEAVRATA